jgi:hypothetical protein
MIVRCGELLGEGQVSGSQKTAICLGEPPLII